MQRDYAELQVATNFSFLRGASHPEELVATAHALGLAALAITDRNTLAGVVRAHAAARSIGLRLIIGCRLTFLDGPDILCLPRDRPAYARLSQLLTLGNLRAPKGECHLRLADLEQHAQGQVLIVVPPRSWHPRPRDDDPLRALAGNSLAPPSCPDPRPGDFEADLLRVREIARGARRAPVYLALTHYLEGNDAGRLAALTALAARHGIRPVATGDVLYHSAHRRPVQDVLTCIREKLLLSDAGRRLAANCERHLRSPASMSRLMRGFELALESTIEIAGECRFSLDELIYEYPDEPVPEGRSPDDHLSELVREGLLWRYPSGPPAKVKENVARELALIRQLSYAPYFLTVHDIVVFARSRGILCQGRGSAANSAVCYCLGITSVDPAEIDVLFERFISPERREPPDIDVDFEHERREEVIQYIYARYGRDRAGLAATVIRYRARSAVREVGKVLGLGNDTLGALAGMVWGSHGSGVLPREHIVEAGLEPDDPLIMLAIELTREIIGFPRHLSQHVGGFVLTRGPLSSVVPISNAAMPERTFIEWDKDDLDELGLLKIDVLSLGMLSCIKRCFDLLVDHGGRELTLASVPREDPVVYDMLCRADSIGVFQVESRAQMNMLPRLKPRCFYDLVIEVAIVRPGPIQGDMVHPYLRRRDGLEPEHYPSPSPEHGPPDELRRILGKTRGVPLFQEQAMRIAMVAARFSAEEVNSLRKAMATFRRVGTIGQLEEKMVTAMIARGYEADFARRCFSQIKGFGEYGFPESHAASFAHLVYVSSWLKCHHPAAFACALLNSQPMGFYAPAQIVRDAREHGVVVRPVDVNLSDWDSTLEPDGKGGWALRLGMREVDGLDTGEAVRILEARCSTHKGGPGAPPASRGSDVPPAIPGPYDNGAGPFASDPPPRLRGRVLPPRQGVGRGPAPRHPFRDVAGIRERAGTTIPTLERLAAADAMRSLGLDRRQALWEVRALARAPAMPLFSWAEAREHGPENPTVLPEMTLGEHVVSDYQTLRLSLKAHPMAFLRADLTREGCLDCDGLRGLRDGAPVSVAGIVLVRQRPGSAKGVVFMTIEDETGVANAIVWPATLERFRRVVMGARLVHIRGRIQRHESIIHVVAGHLEDRTDWLQRLTEEAASLSPPVARADEVRRPGPEPSGWTPGRHPRQERVIPKSRDFH
ncbi:MAG: DNA polymerase III subunit alpha [Rhizobiales bacterium]|nr:DNA polymerase III subunit alpha [Hyphomicrobiales bacterium]